MSTTQTGRLFLSAADLSDATIVRLRHPRDGHTVSIARAGDTLMEVQRWSDGEPHSWLIAGAERVLRDGVLFVATPLDPIFLLISHLRELRGASSPEHKGYFRPLSELVSGSEDEAALEATVLVLPTICKRLRAVCEVKDNYDEPMLRLSDEKTLAWLRRKVAAVKAHLAADAAVLQATAQRAAATHTSQFDDAVTPGFGNASSSTTSGTGGSAAAALADAEAQATALALVCEYLMPEMQAMLCRALKLDEELVLAQRGPAKRAAVPSLTQTASNESIGSSARTERAVDEPAVAPPPAKKLKPAIAPAAKKLGSMPLKKGQTSLASFFGKPK